MNRLKRCVAAMLCLALALAGFSGCTAGTREVVVISMPYSEYIRNIDTNYYKQWLEQKTGLSIRFNLIQEAYGADYLRSVFASGHVQSDAFFSIFHGGEPDGYNEVLQEFGL